MEELGKCTYCFRTGRARNLTPLYEKGKPDLVRYYCPHCLPNVKLDIYKLPWSKLYHFGLKGEKAPDN